MNDPLAVPFSEIVAAVAAPPRRGRWLLTAAVLILALGFFVVAGAIVSIIYTSRPWNPIGPYPVQTVLDRIAGSDYPTVRVGQFVHVRGTKCAHRDVETRGSSVWQSVSPAGTIVQIGAGVGHRPKGCVTKVFQNPIPPEVAAAAKAGVGVWRIVGTETPVGGPAGKDGVPKVWETEPFRVVA